MLDSFNRKISYLRISVTDRCNLRCTYCMPEEGIQLIKHDDILSFDEIVEVVKIGTSFGINKVRITGGEPLVRKNIVYLIEQLAAIREVKDLSMTTNGILLSEFAQDLKNAGLQRVNISLDSLNPEKFATITRGGDINQVLKGIAVSKKVGLHPIKINCVIEKSASEPDAIDVAAFCKQNDLECRFIRQMDLDKGKYWKVKGGEGGDCSICNRLRLTSNGRIKPCLFDNQEYNIHELGIENAIKMAVHLKPRCGTLNSSNKFHNIGG